MLDSLKQAGRNMGRELSRNWVNLSEGWREMLSRSSTALTHFSHGKQGGASQNGPRENFPRWGILAGEVEEKDKEVVVHLEAPGMEKEDISVTIEGNVLYLSGEKRYERETHDSIYHMMERAYGSFQRTIPLPCKVDADSAQAVYKNGVLNIRLPKLASANSKTINLT